MNHQLLLSLSLVYSKLLKSRKDVLFLIFWCILNTQQEIRKLSLSGKMLSIEISAKLLYSGHWFVCRRYCVVGKEKYFSF